MNNVHLLSEEMSLIGPRAGTWLQGLFEPICADARIRMTSILQALTGYWICEKALGVDMGKPDTQSLAREVQRRLNLDEQEAFSALLSSDAALIFLCAGILRAFGNENTMMESFIREVASGIQMHKDQDQVEAAELFTARFLLHKLDLHPCPDTCGIDSSRISHITNLFQADESVVRSLAADIAATTVYGQKPPSAEPELLKQLTVVIPIWMLCYLRQHNLEMGALLLRTMNYLRLQEDIAFQMGFNFVLEQQQLDGHFGFLAPEISRFRSMKPCPDVTFELYLPFTVSCLWVIAEVMNPEFVLVKSF